MASNLAVYLASIGRRVVLADADPQGANLHTLVDVLRPRPGWRPDPESDERLELPKTWPLLATAIPSLHILHAGLDEAPAGERRRHRMAHLRDQLDGLDADYVVVDVGSGLSASLLDFHMGADLGLFVSLPEPTAVENTHRFLRYAFARFIRMRTPDKTRRVRLMTRVQEMGGAPAPVDLWRRLEDEGDPLADDVRLWMEDFAPNVVLNQTRLRADMELGDALRSAARRRFGIRIEYLGYIDYDDTVWSCVRNRRQLLVESPGTKASKALERIARRLLAQASGKARPRPARSVPQESHHDLLEVDRGATDEEIRRAYKRVREIYAHDAMCCYGLYDDREMDQLRTRLEEAYDVLLDPARRRPYERSVFPMDDDERFEAPEPGAERHTLPPPPEITPDTDFGGSLLRQVRESQGVGLDEISQRTKVGVTYLQAIEAEEFRALPAPVYVRGWVSEIAKCLKLDALQVSRTYVRRYLRHIEETG